MTVGTQCFNAPFTFLSEHEDAVLSLRVRRLRKLHCSAHKSRRSKLLYLASVSFERPRLHCSASAAVAFHISKSVGVQACTAVLPCILAPDVTILSLRVCCRPKFHCSASASFITRVDTAQLLRLWTLSGSVGAKDCTAEPLRHSAPEAALLKFRFCLRQREH